MEQRAWAGADASLAGGKAEEARSQNSGDRNVEPPRIYQPLAGSVRDKTEAVTTYVLGTAIVVVETLDVILSEITSRLYLDELQGNLAWIL